MNSPLPAIPPSHQQREAGAGAGALRLFDQIPERLSGRSVGLVLLQPDTVAGARLLSLVPAEAAAAAVAAGMVSEEDKLITKSKKMGWSSYRCACLPEIAEEYNGSQDEAAHSD